MKKSNPRSRRATAKSSRSNAKILKIPSKPEPSPQKRGQLAAKRTRNALTPQQQLAALAKSVRKNHSQCSRRLVESIQHALRVGRDLIEAKGLCAHGEWLGWLEQNCEIGEREAQRYMRFARHFPEGANPTDLSDLSAMSQRLLAIATAKSAKNEEASDSDDQDAGNDSDQEDDENNEGDEEEAGDEEPEEDDSHDEGTDDDDSDASGTDDEEDDDSADEEEDADGTDDEEDGAAMDNDEEDDEEEDDDQEEAGDLDAAIYRIVRLAEEMAVVAESHLDDLEPIETKAARRTLQKARKVIRRLLGTVSATRED